MSNESLEEKNKKIRERMLNFTEIRLGPFPTNSPWLRPIRMCYIQDGKAKTWDLMRGADSVSIIVFNISRKKLIFVKQFRPAVYISFLPEKHGIVDLKQYPVESGITLELCAGTVDKDKTLIEIAQDELREECGYEAPLTALQKIVTYGSIAYPAKKGTLFYVEVTDDMNIHSGGGLEEEGELIEIVEMSVEETKKYINSEEVQSPASFLNGVSWFLINKKDRYQQC